jgi:hypothetical protein
LALTHASVIMEDAVSNRSLQWRELELGTDAWRANRSGRLQLITRLVSPDAALAGKLNVSARYHFGDTLANGMLSAARVHYAGDVGAMSVGLIKSADLSLDIGSANWQANGWTLSDAQLAGSGKLNEQSLNLAASLPNANWDGTLQARAASGQLRFAGTTTQGIGGSEGELILNLKELVSAGKNTSTARIDGRWKIHASDRSNEGELRAQFQHDAKTGQFSLDNIAGTLSLTHPLLNAANAHARLQGSARWRPDAPADTPRADLNLAATFGNDAVNATASFTSGGAAATPLITARLDSTHFDIDRLLTADAYVIDFPSSEALRGWALGCIIQGENIKLGGVSMSSVHIPVKVTDGKLSSAEHEIALYGGKLAGNLSYDSGKQDLALNETLRDIQLDALARDARIALPLTGLTNATLDVRSHGAELRAMPDKATGTLRLYAKNARWLGLDLPHSMLALHAGKAMINTAQSVTPLAEISAVFAVKGPSLDLGKFTARSDAIALTGSGNIQYVAGQMDVLLNARAGNDKALTELRGQRMSLRARGHLTRPQLYAEVPGGTHNSAVAH